MYVRADGNVGIGTTSPAGKLDIFGEEVIGMSTTERMHIGSVNNTNNFQIRTNATISDSIQDDITKGSWTMAMGSAIDKWMIARMPQ